MILVAGGTGHLGGPLLGLLAARDRRARVLSRDAARARARMPAGVEVVTGDVRDRTSLDGALVGIDTVVSAITGFGPRGGGVRQVDLEGNRNLIAAARAAGVTHFVLVSIHGATPRHPMELYRAKFAAEEELRAGGLEWTIIRPTVFMELWADIVGGSIVKGGSATVFGRGDNPINFVSARDIAEAIVLAVDDRRLRGATVELGGPQNLTLNQVARIVAEANRREVKARHLPLPALRLGAVVMRAVRPDLAGLMQASVHMDTADMTFDSAAVMSRYPEIRLHRLEDVVVRPVAELRA